MVEQKKIQMDGAKEGKKARIRVLSRLTEPDGQVHELKNARSGLLKEEDGKWILSYEDVQEDEKAHITLTMHREKSQVQMDRRGMVSSTLHFVTGEKIASRYVTIYGEIPVAVHTYAVHIKSQENGGQLVLQYDVYMGGERTSSAVMDIAWRV